MCDGWSHITLDSQRSTIEGMGRAVHTIETSDAKNQEVNKNGVESKYKNLTSRKFFTSILAAKISGYEEQRIKDGLPVGGWVTNCSYDAKKAIVEGNEYFDKTIYYRDGSSELFKLKSSNYGKINEDGELEINAHQKRWIRLFNCGSRITRLEKDGEVFYEDKNHDCNDKMCMRCSKKKSFQDFVKYRDIILDEINEPVMLVLHQRNPKEGELNDCLDQMYSDLRAMNKQNAKDAKRGVSSKWSTYWSLEITTNTKDRSFHPHFHIITERAAAQEILNKWIAKSPESRTEFAHRDAISDVIRDESKLIEAFKYVTKISTDEIDSEGNVKVSADGKKKSKLTPIPMLYELLMSMYNRRRNGATGLIYNNRKTNEQSKEQIVSQVREAVRKDGFDINDNPIVDLCLTWRYDHKRTNYFGVTSGVEFSLSDFKPSNSTLDFLRIKRDDYSNLNDNSDNIKTTFKENKRNYEEMKVDFVEREIHPSWKQRKREIEEQNIDTICPKELQMSLDERFGGPKQIKFHFT